MLCDKIKQYKLISSETNSHRNRKCFLTDTAHLLIFLITHLSVHLFREKCLHKVFRSSKSKEVKMRKSQRKRMKFLLTATKKKKQMKKFAKKRENWKIKLKIKCELFLRIVISYYTHFLACMKQWLFPSHSSNQMWV